MRTKMLIALVVLLLVVVVPASAGPAATQDGSDQFWAAATGTVMYEVASGEFVPIWHFDSDLQGEVRIPADPHIMVEMVLTSGRAGEGPAPMVVDVQMSGPGKWCPNAECLGNGTIRPDGAGYVGFAVRGKLPKGSRHDEPLITLPLIGGIGHRVSHNPTYRSDRWLINFTRPSRELCSPGEAVAFMKDVLASAGTPDMMPVPGATVPAVGQSPSYADAAKTANALETLSSDVVTVQTGLQAVRDDATRDRERIAQLEADNRALRQWRDEFQAANAAQSAQASLAQYRSDVLSRNGGKCGVLFALHPKATTTCWNVWLRKPGGQWEPQPKALNLTPGATLNWGVQGQWGTASALKAGYAEFGVSADCNTPPTKPYTINAQGLQLVLLGGE